MFGNVTSSWANPQGAQQPAANAFGTPSAFGATNTTNAFGSTSAFGQPQQQQTPAANPMFGNLSTPAAGTGTSNAFGGGAFGNTANANTGAFGAKPAGAGFGAFGGGGTSGTPSAFGGTTTGAFGQPAATTTTTSGLFGQPATSTTGTTSAFGGGGLFGQNKPATSAFGSTTLGTAAPPAVTTGTVNPAYAAHHEKDGNQTAQYQSIVCMPAYAGYSFDELRFQDYSQGRKTASATGAFGASTSAFGATPAAQPSTGLFGATPAQPATSAFGAIPAAPAANAFGAFGATNTAAQPATGGGLFGGGGAFGATAAQPAATTSAFGGFGAQQQQQPQQSTGLFGGANNAFGANANAAKPAGFGAFGAAPSTTGTTNNAFGGFGQNTTQTGAQPATTGGLFGTTPAANTGAFGGGGAFGNTAAKPLFGATTTTPAAPTANAFGGFGATQQPAQQQQGQTGTGLFGQGAAGLFGQNTQQQQPAGQAGAGTGLFGAATTNTQPAGGLFGGGGLFGNTQQQQQQPAAAGLFGAKPAAPAAGGGLFGGTFGQTNAAAPAAPGGGLFGGAGTFGQSNANQQSTFGTGLFGNKPAAPAMGTAMSTGQPTGLFGSTPAGSMNAFGASAAPPQASLTATINQPIGSNLPIFNMLPPGPRLVDLDQTQPKKKAPFFVDLPTRAPVARAPQSFAPASSKLRGFGASTAAAVHSGNPFTGSTLLNGKPGALSLTDSRSGSVGPDILGRAGSPALGSGSRQSVKKVILDKKIEPSQLFIKSGSPIPGGKVVFSPALSIAARESEAAALAAKSSQQLDSPTPAPRAPPKKSSTKFTAAQSTKNTAEQPGGSSGNLEEGDYWVKPDLNSLKALGYDELSAFKGLVVGRVGYGKIEFLDPVDLTGLSKLGALLGDVIHFEDKECSVYPDSEDADKPPPGSGLNVNAKITLERCWPVDKATREPIMEATHPNVQRHLKRLKGMKDTHFENFDMETGKWTFKVDHF